MARKTETAKKTIQASPAKRAATKNKKGTIFECRLCGYRIIVDEACGCAEEHVFVCCDQPMKKKMAVAK